MKKLFFALNVLSPINVTLAQFNIKMRKKLIRQEHLLVKVIIYVQHVITFREKKIDWKLREKQLSEICDKYRKRWFL